MSWETLEPDTVTAKPASGVLLQVQAFGKHKSRVVRLIFYPDALDATYFDVDDMVSLELGTAGADGQLKIKCANDTGKFLVRKGRAKNTAAIILPASRFDYPAGTKVALEWKTHEDGALVVQLPAAADGGGS